MTDFDNIDQILAHQFVGNYHSDAEAFAAIDRFALNRENTLADRAAAIRHMMCAGMGLDEYCADSTDEQLVAEAEEAAGEL